MSHLVRFARAAALVSGIFFVGEAHAVDLSGAWTFHADQCSKVFTRKGRASQIGFTATSDRHGGGFIIEADRLRGKFVTCKIKSKKDDGQTVNILAGCATDIMLSNIQFNLKVLNPNKILRLFPGIQDIEIGYERCPI